MNEEAFKRRLTRLIKSHPCDVHVKETHDEWREEFSKLLNECDTDQADRALDLFSTHIKNDHTPGVERFDKYSGRKL